MTSFSSRQASAVGTLALVAGLVFGLVPSPAMAERSNGVQPVASIEAAAAAARTLLNPIERLEAARVTLLLTDVQRVPDETPPPSAASSMIPLDRRQPNVRHIGVDAPEGVVELSPEWFDARLISVEDAEVTSTYYDSNRGYFIDAGFEYPTEPDQDRKPWLLVVMPEIGVPATCEFVVTASKNEKERTWKLLEVVAIDAEQIFLTAATDDGDEFLVAAAYAFK